MAATKTVKKGSSTAARAEPMPAAAPTKGKGTNRAAAGGGAAGGRAATAATPAMVTAKGKATATTGKAAPATAKRSGK